MNIRKFASISLSIFMGLNLTGCRNMESSKKDNDKITVWAWDETFNIKAVKEAAKIYEDNEIEIVTMAQDDIVQKLHTNLSSGKTDGLPDIVLIEDYKIQNYLTAYPDSFVELNSIINEDDFDEYKFSVNKVNDKIYGVPFDSGVAALFYRVDYVKQAGYTMADMENLTWEEYIEIGKTIKNKTGKDMLTLDSGDIGQIRIMMQSAGQWYVKEDGETINIKDNQALKQGIEIYRDMINAGIVKQVADWDSFVSAFQQGEVASVPTGCWIGSSIIAVEDLAGKWAITQIPRLNANKNSVNASSIGGGGWYVINKSEDKNLKSMDFLSKTFASSSELMNSLAKEINLVSTLKAAKETENYKLNNQFFSNQPIFEMMAEWSGKVPAVNYGLHTYEIEDVITEAVQAVLNGKSIDDALENAQIQAESVIMN
ncbi:MAG: extracellular solute-binding protein [Thomasclavelia sp.]|uniref:extracellular solute-binding protein n=1 Tax=Thomasclavelia sp. TaxID=3025757 RepID=UPI0039A279AA